MSLPPNPHPAGGQQGFCKSCFPNGKVALSQCDECKHLSEVIYDGWGEPEKLCCGHQLAHIIHHWPCPKCGQVGNK